MHEGISMTGSKSWAPELIACIYSFLQKYGLLDRFPNAKAPTLPENKLWVDPIAYDPESKDNLA